MNGAVSVKDIAKKLDISLSTVHKALTGKPGVSEERRRQVINTAHDMGYRVNPLAQSLSRKNITLGVFMPSDWQDYFRDMRKGMEEETAELEKFKVRGLFYDIGRALSENDRSGPLSWLRENRVNALIYCSSMYSPGAEFAAKLKETGLPVFLAGGETEGIDCISRVETDAAMAGRLAADFLRGVHPSGLCAAVFTGSEKIRSHREKVEAFRERVEGFGGRVAAVCETFDDDRAAYSAAEKVCSTVSGLNAIYVATATSLPVSRFLKERALSEKTALVCTDIFEGLKEYMLDGTVRATVCQKQEQVGRIAVRSAYEYLIAKSSCLNEEYKSAGTVHVRPAIALAADAETLF